MLVTKYYLVKIHLCQNPFSLHYADHNAWKITSEINQLLMSENRNSVFISAVWFQKKQKVKEFHIHILLNSAIVS